MTLKYANLKDDEAVACALQSPGLEMNLADSCQDCEASHLFELDFRAIAANFLK